ncbi:MAG TPA: hypothetical protein VFB24_06950, partial [Candidatus Binatia bacterium]|nr:hypothetical protein [Candidatus Binatia bacterium]
MAPLPERRVPYRAHLRLPTNGTYANRQLLGAMYRGPIKCSWTFRDLERNSVMLGNAYIDLPDEFNAATYFIDR